MKIKQFNASYLAHDDRLLFRFNTDENAEFRFWLTRRVTLFILAATQHLIVKKLEQTHTPQAAKAIAEFGTDAVNVNQDQMQTGSESFQTSEKFPFGADPLLVMDVKCSLEKESLEDLLSLDLILPGGANINLKLAGSILHGMCSLLHQLREHASWGDVPLVVDQAANEQKNEKEGIKPSVH
jgi:hypothetical protein